MSFPPAGSDALPPVSSPALGLRSTPSMERLSHANPASASSASPSASAPNIPALLAAARSSAGQGTMLSRQQSVMHRQSASSSSLPLSSNLLRLVSDFRRRVASNPDQSIAVSAIQVLTSVVRESSATTMMGLERELGEVVAALKQCSPSSIALAAGCELFSRYVTRASLDIPRFEDCVARVLERGEQFSRMNLESRAQIARLAEPFIVDGCTILIHGYSRLVHAVLTYAATRSEDGRKHFNVLVSEGRPNCDGYHAAAELVKVGIPVTMVVDSAIAHVMDSVSLVLLGAEGVAESGGVINKIGSYGLALIAHARGKPVYVAAESYKFARLFPLGQQDLPETREQQQKFTRVRVEETHNAHATTNATTSQPSSSLSSSSSANLTSSLNTSVSSAVVNASADFLFQPSSSSSSTSPSPSSTPNKNPSQPQQQSSSILRPAHRPPSSPSPSSSTTSPQLFSTLNPSSDYTPPELISLLFTDIGVLTPSAVSDELIKLYY